MLKKLSSMDALDNMPVGWLPVLSFGNATAESCYGWHVEVTVEIIKSEEYCCKCGYCGQPNPEEIIEAYLKEKGFDGNWYQVSQHRHSWRRRDVPLYIGHIAYEKDIQSVNEQIKSLIEKTKKTLKPLIDKTKKP